MRINSKKELLEFLIDKRELLQSQEAIDLVDQISECYLGRLYGHETTTEEIEAILFNKMKNVYYEFCFRVIKGAPDFTAKEAIALKQIINFLRKMIESHNSMRNAYEESYQVNIRILDAFRIILSPEFWNSLPDFYRKQVYLRQMRPYLLNIIDIMKEKNKNSDMAKELKKAKDQSALRDLLMAGGM